MSLFTNLRPYIAYNVGTSPKLNSNWENPGRACFGDYVYNGDNANALNKDTSLFFGVVCHQKATLKVIEDLNKIFHNIEFSIIHVSAYLEETVKYDSYYKQNRPALKLSDNPESEYFYPFIKVSLDDRYEPTSRQHMFYILGTMLRMLSLNESRNAYPTYVPKENGLEFLINMNNLNKTSGHNIVSIDISYEELRCLDDIDLCNVAFKKVRGKNVRQSGILIQLWSELRIRNPGMFKDYRLLEGFLGFGKTFTTSLVKTMYPNYPILTPEGTIINPGAL